MNSCAAVMQLALEAVGVKRGNQVRTTPYTFAATASAIRYFDAHPVFVDIDQKTMNIDPSLIEGALTPRTRAIIPVHHGGLPVDKDPVLDLTRRHLIPIIEDAVHSFPASYKGRQTGSIGELTCSSFCATKSITTGEGGMITTNNDEWADRCRIMSLHGISKDAWKRDSAEGNWYYKIIAPSYKYNMTDIAGAMGLGQLRKAHTMRDRRRALAQILHEGLGNLPELEIPPDCEACEHAWHLYMLRLNLGLLRINRAELFQKLKERGIGVSVHFIPLHIHPYYKDAFGLKPEDFPVSFDEYQREISLPIHSKMSDEDAGSVIDAVTAIVQESRT